MSLARLFVLLALTSLLSAIVPRAIATPERAALDHALLPMGPPNPRTRVHRFSLPAARLKVEYADLAYRTPLADALGEGDLIVNGGYWGFLGEQRRILGLVHAGGKQVSPLRAALDGGVLVLGAGRASIVPSASYRAPSDLELAIQCKPRLVEKGSVLRDLKPSGRADRTGVCVRDAGRTLDVYLTEPDDPGPSLPDFATWLAAQGCEQALNLDGGPSTAAGFREHGKLVRIGPGLELPYGLRFSLK